MTRPQLIPNLVAALMLLAALGDWPYGYYTALRWVVTIACLVTSWVAFKSRWPLLGWLFIGLAVLFNPLAIVGLTRDAWTPIDVATAAALLCGIVLTPEPEVSA